MSLNNLKTKETISLDLYNNNIKTINVKQLDTKSRYVKISCTEHGKFIALNPETTSALVRCKKPDGFSVLNACDILTDGTILLELSQQMLATAGKCTVDIMLYNTNLVERSDNDNLELSDESIYLNGITVTDDSYGNVSIAVNEDSEFTTETFTAKSIEDIYKLNIPALSTMTFYLNVIPTAIEHSEIVSSHEYDALIQAYTRQTELANLVETSENLRKVAEESRVTAESARATAEEARAKAESARVEVENQRVKAEEARKTAELERVGNENARQTSETSRNTAETQRNDAENIRIASEDQRTNAEDTRLTNETSRQTAESTRVTNETTRQENESSRISAEAQRQSNTTAAISSCEEATAGAIQATTGAITATTNANTATAECIKATNTVNTAVAQCNAATTNANAAAELCQSVVDKIGVVLQTDIANNLTTETEGMVLDASQGKILNDLIADLQTQMNNMHKVHYGTGEPDDSLGKDGDIYMMIIDNTTATEEGE